MVVCVCAWGEDALMVSGSAREAGAADTLKSPWASCWGQAGSLSTLPVEPVLMALAPNGALLLLGRGRHAGQGRTHPWTPAYVKSQLHHLPPPRPRANNTASLICRSADSIRAKLKRSNVGSKAIRLGGSKCFLPSSLLAQGVRKSSEDWFEGLLSLFILPLKVQGW